MASTAKEKLEGLFKVGVGGRSLKGSEYVADVEKMLVTNVSEAMTRLGYKIIDNITKYAPVDQGILNNPRTFEVLKIQETKIGYRLEIKVNADYVDYVDKGVKPVKGNPKGRKFYKNADGIYYKFKNYGMPAEALKSLEGWAKRKNIEIEATNLRIKYGDDTVKQSTYLPEISSTAKQLAFFIKKNGIEGRNFIARSIKEAEPKFKRDLQSIGTDTLILRIAK
jgi:hypothetical protein